MIYRYFIPFCGLPFYSVECVFWCTNFYIWITFNLSVFFFCCKCFWCHIHIFLLTIVYLNKLFFKKILNHYLNRILISLYINRKLSLNNIILKWKKNARLSCLQLMVYIPLWETLMWKELMTGTEHKTNNPI